MASENNFSLRSNYTTLKETGKDWNPTKISRQDVQIVALTPKTKFDTLMHNVPATSDGYFKIYDAYNNTFPRSESGYKFVNRGCSSDLQKTI